MLDLFKINSKKDKMLNEKRVQSKNALESDKHYPSSVREWNNSIYAFNKKSINSIPCSTYSALKLIKAYFNSFNKNLERKIRTKRLLLRLKRLSTNKIYLSNGEFKHTNNGVLINLYVFNRQKYNYISIIKASYLTNILKQEDKIINLLSSINIKVIEMLKKVNSDKYLLVKGLNTIENDNYKIKAFKSLSFQTTRFHKKLIKKYFYTIKMYLFFKQFLYLNQSKLNYTYLQLLKKHLEGLYNKNVEFNFINLKHFYLNSDILFEAIKSKLTRNRRSLAGLLREAKNEIKVNKKTLLLEKRNKSKNCRLENNELKNYIINSLKYRHVTGFRFKTKGRLSRRYTASRSVNILKYEGNLLDIDSSHRRLSAVVLKGNLKSNIQYTKLNSKTRIGSFGVKGWISGN